VRAPGQGCARIGRGCARIGRGCARAAALRTAGSVEQQLRVLACASRLAPGLLKGLANQDATPAGMGPRAQRGLHE